jgi:hypothetical protein
MGAGCLLETNPSPIRVCGQTFVPPPAPNSGLPEFGALSRPKSDKSDFGWERARKAHVTRWRIWPNEASDRSTNLRL